jgi:hypothetical protein
MGLRSRKFEFGTCAEGWSRLRVIYTLRFEALPVPELRRQLSNTERKAENLQSANRPLYDEDTFRKNKLGSPYGLSYPTECFFEASLIFQRSSRHYKPSTADDRSKR